jgi:hypothetical protein
VWAKLFHTFQFHREDSERRYHSWGNVEVLLLVNKSKLGEALVSKDPLAGFNEILGKLGAYKMRVPVHAV